MPHQKATCGDAAFWCIESMQTIGYDGEMILSPNPTGGLTYHLRALRYGRSLWKTYHHATSHWLSQWNTSAEEIVLIGPSAGYSLNEEFLGRFNKIWLSDLDPFVPWLFRNRFSRLKDRINTDSENYLSNPLSPMEIKQTHPHAAVLFCNVLGQLPFLERWKKNPNDWNTLLNSVHTLLKENNYASFHDRFSFQEKGRFPFSYEGPHLKTRDLAKKVALSTRMKTLEVVDHRTELLGSDLNSKVSTWDLYPGQIQCVEWINSSPH